MIASKGQEQAAMEAAWLIIRGVCCLRYVPEMEKQLVCEAARIVLCESFHLTEEDRERDYYGPDNHARLEALYEAKKAEPDTTRFASSVPFVTLEPNG